MFLNSPPDLFRIRYPNIFELPTAIGAADMQGVQVSANRWNAALLAYKNIYVIFTPQVFDATTYQILQFLECVIAKCY